MKIGYARVSTKEQNLDLQIEALTKEGCTEIFQEKVSGAKVEREELSKCIDKLREGDVLVFWKLDRIGRSMKHLTELVEGLREKGVDIKSLNDPIDTTTASGRLAFNIFASLASFERDLISERTKAGLESARARGRFGGRPKGLSKEAETKARLAESLYKEKLSISEILSQLKISRMTLYNYLRHRGVKVSGKQETPSFVEGSVKNHINR